MRAARLVVFVPRAIAFLAFLMLTAGFNGELRAQTLDDGARELARKVLGNLNLHRGDTLALPAELESHSSLPQVQVAAAFKAFLDELHRNGVQGTIGAPPAAGLSVAVAFSENLTAYLWVAVIRRDLSAETVLVASVPRSVVPVEPPQTPAVTLHKQLLWSQAEQMLDVLPLGPPARKESGMVVLEPERIVLYRQDQWHWRTDSAAAVPHAYPWPRDVRGRLADMGDGLKVFLPGTLCDVTTEKIAGAHCKENSDPWLVAFGQTFAQIGRLSRGKNFFEGEPGGGGMPPRFSLAVLGGGQADLVWYVATLLDGRAVLYENASKPIATFAGWGSDVAVLRTECGQGWQFLVTRTGDWEERDAVQAFEIVEQQAVPVSDPVDFSGPVTALWAEAGGGSAIGVSRNLKTGQYEAYELSITCSH